MCRLIKLLEILNKILELTGQKDIRNLDMGQRMKLLLNQGETGSVETRRGVRQGCCMSPVVFNLHE